MTKAITSGLHATQLDFEKSNAEAFIFASTPPASPDEDMGVGDEDADNVEDAETVEVPVTEEYTEWLQNQFNEAFPLQIAEIKVNALRIEVNQADEKIALGGPTFLLNFLQKNREEKRGAGQ